MALTEAVREHQTPVVTVAPAFPSTSPDTAAAPPACHPDGKQPYRPIPVWFFAFEGVIGASYDVMKSTSYGWVVLVVAMAANLVCARTVLRGRLKMAKALLKGRRTRRLAIGLIALRVGVHFLLGLIGVRATTEAAHLAFAVLMCATTVTVLSFGQRVTLRALGAQRPLDAQQPPATCE